MPDMNYANGEVTDFVIEFFLMHAARCEKVFQAARMHLKPEHFSKIGESTYQTVWAALLDYYERQLELPDYHALSMRILNAIASTPSNVTDTAMVDAHSLVEWMYDKEKYPDEELSPNEALETLREILLDRETGDAIRNAVLHAGGRHIHDLPKLLEKQQRRVEEINSIGRADDDDSTIPDNWDEVIRPRLPTGVSFVDRIMEGGCEAGDCNVILGPAGGGKTTLSMQLACSIARLQTTYTGPNSPIEPGLVVFVGYEDGKRMMQIRAGSCAAHVLKNRLRSQIEAGGKLSTSGNLEQYEQIMYAGTPNTIERLGEQERLEEIKPWMNKYLALVDYHDPKNGGRGHITEIRQKLAALQQKRGLPIRAVFVDWAGVLVRNYLLASYGKVESSTMSLELAGVLHRCKSELAAPFGTTVWISHQVAGRHTGRPPATRPHHSEAQWCTSFADYAWFAFCLGNKDEEHNVCQFVASKTRHGESGPPVLLKINGAFCRMEDVSDKFKPDHAGLRLLPRDDVDRLQAAPLPRRARSRQRVDDDLDSEI
jgi:hypothetical protein